MIPIMTINQRPSKAEANAAGFRNGNTDTAEGHEGPPHTRDVRHVALPIVSISNSRQHQQSSGTPAIAKHSRNMGHLVTLATWWVANASLQSIPH